MLNTAHDPAENVYAFVPAAVYRRKKAPPPPFSEDEILQWADAHHKRHGAWPIQRSGLVAEAPGETWARVDSALRKGARGLLGGSSLALLLFRHRGRRHPLHLARFTEEQILDWADAYFARHGTWPRGRAGIIPECPAVTWNTVQEALTDGKRGLSGGATLAGLLTEKRGAGRGRRKPVLSEAQILAWADAHYQRTGEWPRTDTGRIEPSADETWSKVHSALSGGGRGLPGGSSLAALLAEKRNAANIHTRVTFTEDLILGWADAHFARTGEWPLCDSVHPIPECPGESWRKVSNALRLGLRGMPGGVSLAAFLEQKRGRRNIQSLPPFTVEQILEWADAFHARTGQWPRRDAGTIAESPDDTWMYVNTALAMGCRGLPKGFSLARLLHERRGVFSKAFQPVLSAEQILGWADEHFARTGKWPHCNSGEVADAPGEKWNAVNNALQNGLRGLPGGSSLALLLQEHRGRRSMAHQPPLSIKQILKWADAHHARTGQWPECVSASDNAVADASGETWDRINGYLNRGQRGLPGGTTLARLLQEKRGKRNIKGLPPLTIDQILEWADAHFARHGTWPRTGDATPIPGTPGEKWCNISQNLKTGDRSLPGGSSLTLLLEAERGVRVRSRTTPLSVEQIAAWAQAHRERTGTWPTYSSGEALGGDGTLWAGIDTALKLGNRGLPGGSTLRQVCAALEEDAVQESAVRELPRAA